MQERPLFFPQRFQNAARYYTTGRPTYPKLLIRRVVDLVGLSYRVHALDLGTGPGFLAIDFAPFAKQVTAIDPSPEMLAVARENVERAGAKVRLVQGSSYERGPELGRVRRATIGRAFHWMDRAQTLASLGALLDDGGAIALFSESYPNVAENAWRREFQAILEGYTAADPAKPVFQATPANEELFLASPFDHLERLSVIERRETPLDRFADRALSYGSTWQGKPGSREDDLAEDIRKAIAKYADESGVVREVIEGHALVARRSADLSKRWV